MSTTYQPSQKSPNATKDSVNEGKFNPTFHAKATKSEKQNNQDQQQIHQQERDKKEDEVNESQRSTPSSRGCY
jgi:hypothetical protein